MDMFFTRTTFIGIDPTAGQKPFTYAALDHELRILALGEGNLDEVLAFAAGQRQAYIAVCAPRQPNQGVMADSKVRDQLSPQPAPGRWTDFRLVEYLLRQHNISTPKTASKDEDCPNWMQMGFTLHKRLSVLGYQVYPCENVDRQCLEVYPFASYSSLLGVIPFPKNTLEGRLQRQLALYEHKVKLTDPMRVFEEITRFRLLKGVLPLDGLYSAAELDTLVAAYTAWSAALHKDEVLLLGDREEGQIVLPVKELKERY